LFMGRCSVGVWVGGLSEHEVLGWHGMREKYIKSTGKSVQKDLDIAAFCGGLMQDWRPFRYKKTLTGQGKAHVCIRGIQTCAGRNLRGNLGGRRLGVVENKIHVRSEGRLGKLGNWRNVSNKKPKSSEKLKKMFQESNHKEAKLLTDSGF